MTRPVFIHISKNAGTSVISTAGDQIVNAGHQLAASWMTTGSLDGPVFAVIRHPYDRALSEYRYRRRRLLSGEQNPHLANLDLPVDQWIEATYVRGDFRTREFFTRTGVPFGSNNMVDGNLIWFVPQATWLGDGEGNLLVHELLRFESLASDWAEFADRHHIQGSLAHLNAAPALASEAVGIAAATKDILYEYFRGDFDAFGYER